MAMRKNNVAITGSALDVLLDNALNFEIDTQNSIRQARLMLVILENQLLMKG